MILPGDRVYISGPMTGIPEFNYPAFFRAEARISDKYRCAIINPARQEEKHSWEEYMRADVSMLRDATVCVLLPGWEQSRGAKIEVSLAQMAGVPIYSLREVLCYQPKESICCREKTAHSISTAPASPEI